ncbi:Fe(3+)-hydroxamate ABC transporter permease FhuB [Brucella pituitosa]|uniref:Fe(3+)-hydroxamate ABC transporter permease FhuB n=1 Tax=Brucella pituitosa TaxID=571256 RepID=UPI003F4AEF76
MGVFEVRSAAGVGFQRCAILKLTIGLSLFAAILSFISLNQVLPYEQWYSALKNDHASEIPAILFSYAYLPRIAVSILAGAALGLSGCIFQQVLQNPLAEPTTLGVSTGAQLALVLSMLWWPGSLEYSRESIAIAGSLFSACLVFIIAGRDGLSSISLIMAGLVVNMTLGSLAAITTLFNHEFLSELFVWQSGRLEQDGWHQVQFLGTRLALALVIALAFLRPLSLMEIGEESALGLGLRGAWVRPLILLVPLLLAASIVSAIGVIAFIGLAAPALARLAGARRLRERLIGSAMLGSAILWLADQLVQAIPMSSAVVPTGVATAMLGAPLLLLLLGRANTTSARPQHERLIKWRELSNPAVKLVGLLLILLLLIFFSACMGRGEHGWVFQGAEHLDFIGRWRAPRIISSLGAGLLLGLAGVFVQRMFGNSMASPEVLGISSGASLGVITLVLLLPLYQPASVIAAAAIGALGTTGFVLLLNNRFGYSPQRTILFGVALGTLLGAISEFLIAGGGSARTLLLTWMSGSTYRADWGTATSVLVVAAVALLILPLFGRWLTLLPLGESTARSMGLDVKGARGLIILAASLMTAAATIVVGPLSFIGLMAPHIARAAGFRKTMSQLYAAALLGAIILVAADLLGRIIIFPWQVPAGLLSALIGGPYFLTMMWKKSHG